MADEFYQDTVLQAFEMAGRIDATQNPKSFFFSPAIGRRKNVRRKAGRRNAIARAAPTDEAARAVVGRDSPERQAESARLRDCIRAALSQMDDKFRIPLILFYYDDSRVETIAKICKIPPGTVKSRLHKGARCYGKFWRRRGF